MGKSMSRTSSVNRGTEEIDRSRRLEIGLVNVDSHSSGTGLSWFEVISILGFIVTLLFVIWEAVKYCIHRSFRERMLRREENAHLPPPPYHHGGQTNDRPDTTPQVGWVQAPPEYVRLNVPALEMRSQAQIPTEVVAQPSNVSATWRGAL